MSPQEYLIAIGIVSLSLTYIVGLAALGYMGHSAFSRTQTGAAKSFGLLFTRAVPFLTIALVIMAVTLLAILGKLTEGSISILSAIGGYVLGRGSMGEGQLPIE